MSAPPEGAVSGEVHYKAVLDAARVRKRSFEEGRRAGLAEVAPKLGWEQLETSQGFHRFMDHVDRERVNIRTPPEKSRRRPLTGADQPVLCLRGIRVQQAR